MAALDDFTAQLALFGLSGKTKAELQTIVEAAYAEGQRSAIAHLRRHVVAERAKGDTANLQQLDTTLLSLEAKNTNDISDIIRTTR